jgi:hypothetical protein
VCVLVLCTLYVVHVPSSKRDCVVLGQSLCCVCTTGGVRNRLIGECCRRFCFMCEGYAQECGVPVPLVNVLVRALDPKPSNRYGTAVELEAAVADAIATVGEDAG